MMIDPPIDKLIKHAECRYALTVAVAKRARELATTESNYLEKSGFETHLACLQGNLRRQNQNRSRLIEFLTIISVLD